MREQWLKRIRGAVGLGGGLLAMPLLLLAATDPTASC